MLRKYSKKMALYFLLAIFFILIDRILKFFALNYLEFRKLNIIGDIFKLDLAKNSGIAFSIPFSGLILNTTIILIIVIIAIFLHRLIKKKENLPILALTFLLFGAISNMADRLVYGFVVDYLNLKWFTVFNLADVMIVAGAFLLMFNFKNRSKSL
jgi:signal peptidase II